MIFIPSAALICCAANTNKPLVKTVKLTPEEEAELERLKKRQTELEKQLDIAREAARVAAQNRNRIEKERDAVRSKWLALAEKKFPD